VFSTIVPGSGRWSQHQRAFSKRALARLRACRHGAVLAILFAAQQDFFVFGGRPQGNIKLLKYAV
jgi:hypothetical protein